MQDGSRSLLTPEWVLCTVLCDQGVAISVGDHASNGRRERLSTSGPVELCVPEGEDATVTGDHPIAMTIGCRSHRFNGLIEMRATHRPIEARITECEDSTIRGDQPVALAIWR